MRRVISDVDGAEHSTNTEGRRVWLQNPQRGGT
jgi:hypothetical protein